jgi:putative component of toxin-antitoxin plasmid stabilization module
MNTFLKSDEFDAWLSGLKDQVGKAIIAQRIRAYYTRRGEVVYLLLLVGDKSTQKRDIKRAKEMARNLPKE